MPTQEWETVEGLIKIASSFDIGLSEVSAVIFMDEHWLLLASGSQAVENRGGFIRDCWECGSFPLVLKHLMLKYSNGPASPRPKANPNRVFYCLDDYDRVTTIHMASLEVSRSGNEMSPAQEIAYRRWEDSRGFA